MKKCLEKEDDLAVSASRFAKHKRLKKLICNFIVVSFDLVNYCICVITDESTPMKQIVIPLFCYIFICCLNVTAYCTNGYDL